eukprot:CAMPEP_0201970490 /NCGR_PEP_ID=MMETSP0904-20121228/31340_1 /ASSEMBLY_ACC=CAM_ASM_000553 /TAXON_ID=420261 /ORGANISM="Thalassiosira antarctica, Strain CCMP982" /LENGTH=58 /DNA_ID=CAMNT_0048519447 /DNA_START=22 /DNA_END=194 /DNA_ORIENTATION=+
MKDALIEPIQEESACGMGQPEKAAAKKGAPTLSKQEASAYGMAQSLLLKRAVMRDAPT